DTAILGVTFQYTGAFSYPGQASFTQTAGALSDSQTFSTSPFTDSFTITGGPLSIDLTSQIDLLAQDGGSAAISDVLITVTTADATPEPSTIVLLALGGAALFLWRRRSLRDGHVVSIGCVAFLATTFAISGWSQDVTPKAASSIKTTDTSQHAAMTAMGQLAQKVS